MKKDAEEKLELLLADTITAIEEITELVDTVGAAADLFEKTETDASSESVH